MDKEAIYNENVAYWFNGQIGAADIREDVYEAMDEYAAELKKENDELKELVGAKQAINKIHAADIERLQSTIEEKGKIIKQQDEIIGRLTRENENLFDTETKRQQWLSEAKKNAGYDNNESFDNVWKATLEKSSQLNYWKERCEAAELSLKSIQSSIIVSPDDKVYNEVESSLENWLSLKQKQPGE